MALQTAAWRPDSGTPANARARRPRPRMRSSARLLGRPDNPPHPPPCMEYAPKHLHGSAHEVPTGYVQMSFSTHSVVAPSAAICQVFHGPHAWAVTDTVLEGLQFTAQLCLWKKRATLAYLGHNSISGTLAGCVKRGGYSSQCQAARRSA